MPKKPTPKTRLPRAVASTALLGRALDALTAAEECVSEAVAAAFPVGSKVWVRYHRGLIYGTVEDSGCPFFPKEVTITNDKTGKRRRFTVGHHEAGVISRPNQPHPSNCRTA